MAGPGLSYGLIAALAAAAPARAGEIIVTVTNVRSNLGHVRVAICPQATFLQKTCTIHQAVPSKQGTTTVVFLDVPPGEYAAQGFLDEHDWREVRRDLLGFPENGIGFSNDAPINFGPPKWDDARFSVLPDGAVHVHMTLHYYKL
ncbi:DUF2141 domain-containing protein [Acidisphaera rubrifaciens]|uniref:DUF2141 domain-containing protein n=1 Tax=Acidisphaera rubrifaciens HS-AP3 TaxID=1231350 RepID=A0A0D6P8A7_9PROT|nr:DUF2141 domain-containing protein [Acidisphaera rubrifaciens]GAN77438.1 hypothetical protein Asru_0319_02 [Acidisphaera rubrifaciens HS-AP3]